MMQYAYLIIRTTGEIEAKFSNKRDFTLKELQEGVDGSIEIVGTPRTKEIHLVVDDCGLVVNKKLNSIASIIACQNIYGDVILCTTSTDPEPDVYKMTFRTMNECARIILEHDWKAFENIRVKEDWRL